jgi:hypothetical protein
LNGYHAGNFPPQGDFLATEFKNHRPEGQFAVAADLGAAGDAEAKELNAKVFVGNGSDGGALAMTQIGEGHGILLLLNGDGIVKLKSNFNIKKSGRVVKGKIDNRSQFLLEG